ncbi:NAD-dependent epimerase/dehydratase family protein [Thaumasiovibrio subtropicus]|uniref:NAD-dependent epimerase/dehydratase family protein n=1 Tax=Thaumasiovibrio subtropicus TaxID=1891207 RepID=UPI000B353AF2|nr:NAD-dependent epimerase/dehydratase family protein [Thaumasiovibrio subtropicus]
MTTLLITGGTGMLGQAIIRQAHQDYPIRFIGRNQAKLSQISDQYKVEGQHVDLGDKEALIRACENIDAVIHCAALSSPWGKPAAFHQHNVTGTQHLMEAMHVNGVKTLIHVSTPSVYFAYRDAENISEAQPLPTQFCNHYATSKAAAESVVLAEDLHSTILRPRGIFGPEDTAIVPRLLRARRHGVLTLPSSRQPLMDLTYVDNVADACLLALETTDKRRRGEIYNITNGTPTTLQSVLSQLFDALGQPVRFRHLSYPWIKPLIHLVERVCQWLPHQPEPVLTRYSAALLHYHQTLDIRKAQRELGYHPHVSLEEGIERYAKWYLSQTA